MSNLRLEGKTALIVGGTGGIGLASARMFLDEGARVVVAGLPSGGDPSAIDALAPSDRVTLRATDATRPGEIAALFDSSLRWLGGRLDILLHVAGISGRRLGDGPLHECTEEGWEAVMAANARGVFLTNRASVKIMRGQESDGDGLRGSIVNVGSVLAGSPSPAFFDTIAYAASKGAVRALTISAASRYASEKIRFNLIEPGVIRTPMAARAAADPSIRAFLQTKQPLSQGPAEADDVGEAALYLASSASRFVTGTVLEVDGGWRISDGQVPKGMAP